MLAILLICFLLFIIGLIMASRPSRLSLSVENRSILGALMFKGLFDEENQKGLEQWQREQRVAERRLNLLERAKQGDVTTLNEAHPDAMLYSEVLDVLLDSGCQETVERCVKEISQSKELRASARLAERMIDEFKTSPDKKTLAQMLHLAALSDDAAVFEKSLVTAFESWQKGEVAGVSASQLLTLCESEYWVLASEARRSGAGFALKDSLSRIRRNLAAAMRG
jgi:hypothetical protein